MNFLLYLIALFFLYHTIRNAVEDGINRSVLVKRDEDVENPEK